MDWLRRNPAYFGLVMIILLGAFLRFYTIGAKTIWLDEAFSIWVADHSLLSGWSWLIRIDQHPPLYYSLLHFWQMLFGDEQGTVRAFSALCSTLTIPFFYGASRRWTDTRTALIAAFLLAISPIHVRYAQETRMYALLTLGVAIALYFLARLLFDPRARRARLVLLGLATAEAAVMLTHNTATVFFPLALNGAIGGVLLWKYTQGGVSSLPALNDPAFERRWLRTQLLAFAIWLPWSIFFVRQTIRVDQEFWLWAPDLSRVSEVLYNFNAAFLPTGFPGQPWWHLLYWALALYGIYSLRRKPACGILLLTFFLTPIIGELLVSLRRPIFYERTLLWATLPYYLLLAAGLRTLAGKIEFNPSAALANALGRTGQRVRVEFAIQALTLAIVITLSGFALTGYYQDFQKEDWAKAADYVAQNIAPNDLILFNATWVQLPFEYYFRHYNTAAELRGLPVDLFDRGVLEPKMTQADIPYMDTLLANRAQVWLVYSHDWYTDPNQIIPRQLDQSMRQTEQRAFVGLQVMRYEQR